MTRQVQSLPPAGGRAQVRSLKRLARQGVMPGASTLDLRQRQSSVLALLERSIRLGHRRLAVHRLVEAVGCGAPLSADHWAYCMHAAAASKDGLPAALQEAWRRREPGAERADPAVF